MGKKWKIISAAIFFIIFSGLFKLPANKEINLEANSLSASLTESNQAAVPTVKPEESWALLSKIKEPSSLLENTQLKVGEKGIIYQEDRIALVKNKISVTKKKIEDPEKEIALELLDLKTGEKKVIIITKKGSELISPAGYDIVVVARSNGIRWNEWNTQYRVVTPEYHVVIKDKYPKVGYKYVKKTAKDKNGKKITITEKQWSAEEYIYYSPYSIDIHTSEIIDAGRKHIKEAVKIAMGNLREKEVKSRAYPEKIVADVELLLPKFFEHLPLLEQTDLGEFMQNPLEMFQRVLVIIGANDSLAFSKTCSKATACGWVQFIPSTYKTIRKTYPAAKLIEDFEKGSADHINSITAAILLFDYNLNHFIKTHGQKISQDPRLEEYLAAAYNGGPAKASKSLKSSLSARLSDWINGGLKPETGLRSETIGFISKLRYLNENNIP